MSYCQRPAALCVLRGAKHLPSLHLCAQVPQPPEGHLLAPLDHHPVGWQWPQAQSCRASGGGHGEEAQHHHVPVRGLPAPWRDRHPEVGGENEVWRIWKVRLPECMQSEGILWPIVIDLQMFKMNIKIDVFYEWLVSKKKSIWIKMNDCENRW